MAFQPGAMVYTQGFGSRPENVEVPHYDVRAPGATDIMYPLGKLWVDYVNNNEYSLCGFSVSAGITSAVWDLLSIGGSSGVVPVIHGGTGDTTLTAHGVLIGEGTSPVAAVAPSATAGIALVSAGAAADPAYGTVVVAGGGTGAVTLTGILTGNGTSPVTANAVTQHGVLIGGAANAASSLGVAATGTLLAGVTGADPAFTASPSVTGSVTAGTTITATLGAITATNGNVVLGTAGNKIVVATGSNASVGTSGAMSGTPGVVTVSTTACSATAKVFYSRAVTGGTMGNVSITSQDGTGFTLTSTGNETSTFNWWIINA